jgi:hypothetical protein
MCQCLKLVSHLCTYPGRKSHALFCSFDPGMKFSTWSQSYNNELQHQRCKNLQSR